MTKDVFEAAFTTAAQPYPAFVNAQREGDKVTLTIRGEARDGNVGPRASISMDVSEFLWFLGELKFRQVGAA